MIAPELEAEILRLHHAEKWLIGTIARQVGVHHCTVRRVLTQAGIPSGKQSVRPSMADPYIGFIQETLEKYPTLTAARLYHMVRERGYPGGPDHFRAIVARYRPRRPAQPYLRLRTLPGEQAQVDWAHFGKLTIGEATRPLMAFVMVLSYSRQVFCRFYLAANTANFLRGHVTAFEFFRGVARRLLYDNLKSAVLERRGQAVRFNPVLLQLAAHYRFEPRPVSPARGNEKGRVERSIRFLRTSFFAARRFRDIDDLNAQALAWCQTTAAQRPWPEDRRRTVGQLFDEERGRLLALPANPFPTHERTEVRVGKTPYARFDRNDYSVPPTHVRRTLVALADLATVRILDGNEIVASHQRSFDCRRQIEDPAHIQALVEYKRQARQHRGIDRLHQAAPATEKLFAEIAARGGNLGSTTSALIRLLDLHGAAGLEEAVTEALAKAVPHLSAVRQILDQRRHASQRPPAIAAAIPADPRLRDLVVRPHDLTSYDRIENHNHEENSNDGRVAIEGDPEDPDT